MRTEKDTIKNKKALLIALERSLGIVTSACKETGLSRNVFYEYCKSDPQFKEAVEDINEIALDFTESQLLKQIKDGSERSILFYMKYKGRRRGYSDSIDITSGGDKLLSDIKVNIIHPKQDEEPDGN